jgi:uncharacterized membrane protein
MSHVVKSVTISNDPARIIEYIADVDNHPAFIGALKTVGNVSGDPRKVGTTWDWTFTMAGILLAGRAETVAYEPGKRYSFRTTTGVESTFVYTAEGGPKGTKLTIDVTYAIPQTVAGRMQTPVVERLNEEGAHAAVENLKAILDT